MPYIENDVLLEARRVDLLTYLQQNDPGNLVHISGNNYCTRDHDSLEMVLVLQRLRRSIRRRLSDQGAELYASSGSGGSHGTGDDDPVLFLCTET